MNRLSRSSQSQAASIASAVAPIFHSAGSKRFAKARAQTPPSPGFSSTSVTTSVEATHAYPEEKFGVVGERFPVDFNHMYLDGKQLLASRVGYKVRHKSALLGVVAYLIQTLRTRSIRSLCYYLRRASCKTGADIRSIVNVPGIFERKRQHSHWSLIVSL